MPYPPAPWTLHGYAVQTLHLIDIERSRPFIPPEFDIISVFPGKTLGGVYVSSYGQGSPLEYHELIVVAGVVSYSGQWGGWVSHIYVDNLDSVVGGREIWGLPKELAQFTWSKGRVSISQEAYPLCSLNYSPPSLEFPLPLSGTVLTLLDSNILCFKGELKGRLGLISAQVDVPFMSPFSSLNLGQPWLSAYGDDLRLTAGVPKTIGMRSRQFVYS